MIHIIRNGSDRVLFLSNRLEFYRINEHTDEIINASLGVNSRGGVLGGIIEIKGYLLIIIIMCISKILSFKGSKNYGKDN